MQDFSSNLNLEKKTITNLKPIFIIVILFSVIIFFLINFSNGKIVEPIPRSTSSSQTKPTVKSLPAKTKEINLKNIYQDILNLTNESQITFYIYIYDLNSKKELGFNEQTILSAASVNKIPILASLYHLAGKGEINLEKVITIQQKDIQDYGTGVIRYQSAGTTYSVKTLARLMMEKSDNTAAYVLANPVIGLSKIQKLIESWGLTQTDMYENNTSVKDMQIILEKMYREEITTQQLTSEMLGFMDSSDFDDRIPKGLPEGVKFYHKTGDDIGKVHDVAIIDLPDHPYYLGILTEGVKKEAEAKEKMVEISRIVYKYMSSL